MRDSRYERVKFWTAMVFLGCMSSLTAMAGVTGPGFSKNFSPDTIGPGSTTTLTFTIENFDGFPVGDLDFTDVFPAGMTIADAPQASTTCQGGTLTAVPGSGTFSYSGGIVGAGATCTVSVNVVATVAGANVNTSGFLTSDAGVGDTATDTLTVDTGRPGFSKFFISDFIPIGTRTTLVFDIDNAGSGAEASSLAFTDFLPPGLVVADPANISNNCASGFFTGGAVTAVPGSGEITLGSTSGLDTPAVAAGGTCQVSVDVVPTGVGLLENVSGNLTGSNPFSFTSGFASAAINVVSTGDLLLTKEFLADPVPSGGTVDLEFTIFNLSRDFQATNLTFSDDLDFTLTGLVATGLPASNVCGTGSTISGTDLITLTGGNLAAGDSCTFTVTLQIPGGTASGAYPNLTSSISGDIDGSPVVSDPAFDVLFVEPVPLLTKAFLDATTMNPDPVVGPGDDVIIEFSVTNTSTTSAATDITFNDVISQSFPVGTPVVTPTNPCGAGSSLFNSVIMGTNPSQTLILLNGTLAAGDTCTFQATLTLPAGLPPGIYPNLTEEITATVDAATVIGAPASDALDVVAAPLLRKLFTDDPAVPGGTATLEFTLDHDANSPGDATNITFTDDLAAVITGLTAASLPLTDLCGPGNGTIIGSAGDTFLTFSGATLMPGETCTFDVTLNIPAAAPPGAQTNTTSTIAATVLGVPVTGPATSDDLDIAALEFSKSFINDPVLPGGTVDLEFTITNISPTEDATNIIFTDSLSTTLSGLVVSGAPLPTNPCGAGSSISGTSFLIFVGGNLLAGESCTFSVELTVPGGAADGSYGNITSNLTATIGGSTVVLDPANDALDVDSNLIGFTKEFIDDPAMPGGTTTLRFTLTNLDPANSITNIDFTDDLDAALTGLTATGLPTTECGGSVTGTSLITFSGGTLTGGEVCSFDVVLSVPSGAPLGTTPTNTTSGVTGMLGGVSVTGAPASDDLTINFLSLTKSFDGPTAAGGAPVLTFTIQNEDSINAVTDINFSDDLDAVLSGLVSADGTLDDICGFGSSISGSSFLTFSGGSLDPGGFCTFDVTLTVPAGATPGLYANTTSDVTVAGLISGAPATADLDIQPPPEFAKTFAPDAIGQNLVSTLTFNIDNSASTLAATALDFTDNLPAGMTVASPANASTTCTGGTLDALAGSGDISYTGGSVAAGATCTIQVDVTGTSVGALVNTSGDLTSSSGNSGPATDTLTVDPAPAFSKAFAPNPIAQGGVSTLTFTIDNTGAVNAATSLDFNDTLPMGLVIATPANAVSACASGTLTAVSGTDTISYSGGSVAASATCTLSVDVTGTGAGSFANTSSALTSSLGSSGTASDTLVINPPPNFSKAFSPDPAILGGVSTLTFTIENTATAAATALDFTDSLPVGMTVATPSNAANTCGGGTFTATSGSAVITYSGGTLAAMSTCTLSVDVTTSSSGDFANLTGNLTSSLGDSGTAADSLRVNPPPSFAKAFAPNPSTIGGTATLTFTIDNSASTVDATALDFTDNLPAGLVVATPANAVNTCVGGTLTAVAGSGSISYTTGSVPTGMSCTLTVDVTASAAGDLANTSGDLTSSLGNSGPATDTLTVNAPPTFAKAFAPNPSIIGGASTLTFTIDNTGSTADATDLAFIDSLPTGMTVATPANAATTCTGGTLNAVSGTALISYTLGTVSAAATCTITVDVTTSAEGDFANTSGDLTSSLGNSGTASDTLRVNPPPAFTKAFSPDPIFIGEVSTLTFTIDNSASTAAAGSLDFTDNLPAGLEVANPANASTTCTGGTIMAVNGTTTLSYSGGTVAAGASCTLSVDVTATASGDLANTSGDLTSSLGNSGPAMATLSVNPPPLFSKAFTPNMILPGGTSTLIFTIDNTAGTATVGNLDFTDNLPADVLIANPANASTTCTGGMLTAVNGTGVITYTGGTIGAASTCTLSVDVTSSLPNTYTNTSGDLTSDAGNSGPAIADLIVNMGTDITVSITDAPDPVIAGNQLTYTATATNNGPSDAVNTVVTTTLPPAVTLDSSSGCAEDPNGAPTCSLGTITSGGSAMFTLTVTVDPSFTGVLTAQVDIDTDTAQINTGDESATTDTQVNAEADLSALFAGPDTHPGEDLVLTLTVANAGPSDAPGSSVAASIAAELTGVTWTCASSAGSTCTASATGDIVDTVDINAGGNVVYTITGTVPDDFLGDLVSDATVTAGVTDPDNGNDSDTFTSVSTSPSDVFAELSASLAPTRAVLPVEEGSVFYLLAVLTNASLFDQFDDPGSDEFINVVPAGLQLESAQILSGGGVLDVNTTTNTVTWNGAIPSMGMIEIQMEVSLPPVSAGQLFVNQGMINFDSDGDGINDTQILTDDPEEPGTQDPTVIGAVTAIPTLQTWGLILFVLGLMAAAIITKRRNLQKQ